MSKHTWHELAEAAAGRELTMEESRFLLFECSPFPLGTPRETYYMIQSEVRKGARRMRAQQAGVQ